MRWLAGFWFLGAACLGWAENHALLIGIDEYKDRDGLSRLAGAENDVAGLAKALEVAAGFKRENIRTLVGAGASKLSIIRELEDLASRTKPGDFVWFSFSGHGFQPGDKVFLIPWDAVNGSDAVIQNTSVEAAEVARLLGQVNADVLVATFDMCRNDPRVGRDQAINSMSIAMDRDLRVKPTASGEGPRRILRMFASSQGQRSWEKPDVKRGYFSYFLEKGLSGEACRDGKVTVSSLTEYLEQEVLNAVLNDRKVEQRPDVLPMGSQLLGYVLCAPANPAVRSGSEFDRLYKEALLLLTYFESKPAEDIRKARGLLSKADAIDPHNASVKWLLGRCETREGSKAEAETYYRRSIELDSHLGIAYHDLFYLLDSQGRIDQAGAVLRQLISIDSRNVLAYLNLSYVLHVQGKFSEAAAMLQLALDINPKEAAAYERLGDVLIAQDKPIEAERAFRRAMDLGSSSAACPRGLGWALEAQGNLEGAKDMYRQAISLAPKDGYAYSRLHAILVSQGKSDEAKKLREEASKNGVTINP